MITVAWPTPASGRGIKLTTERRAAVVTQLHLDPCARRAAAACGVSRETAERIAHAAGIGLHKGLSPARRAEVVDQLRQDPCAARAALACGVSRETARFIAQTEGIALHRGRRRVVSPLDHAASTCPGDTP